MSSTVKRVRNDIHVSTPKTRSVLDCAHPATSQELMLSHIQGAVGSSFTQEDLQAVLNGEVWTGHTS